MLLISAVHHSDSVTHMCSSLYLFPLWFITGYWIWFFVLCSRALLFIHAVCNSLHQKAWVFKSWDELVEKCWRILGGSWSQWLSHLCLLIGTDWSQVPTLPQGLVDRGTVFLDYHFSKGWLPGPWERYFWAVKLGRVWVKIYISKEQRKNLQMKFFYAQKKREVRASSLEQTCVNLVKLRKTLRLAWSVVGRWDTGFNKY